MTSFLTAAGLVLAATLFLLLRPLLRGAGTAADAGLRDGLNLALLREQLHELDAERAAGRIDAAAHARARAELQQRVAEEVRMEPGPSCAAAGSRWPAIAVGVMVPVFSACLYVYAGVPMALAPAQQAGHEASDQQVAAMVDGLAARLRAAPQNAGGWEMLARSYNALGRYRDAADAYAKLVALVPDDAAYYADYADTLAMAQGQSLQGEPEKLVDKALALDGANLKALALSGSAAFERGELARAVAVWEKLAALAPPGSDVADATAGGIAQAKKLMTQAGAAGGSGQ